ncbi:telomere-protecting terminal protein Tpg [Streptomyces zaomyceticus]|uniref:telomere-protecting terminal protein Tpg n=1 Tax=Streptomyces zaomyceticus TaxID=68286 RepID=UPI0036CF8642
MTIDAALHGALAGAFTRPIPKSAGAQVRYLVKQHHDSTKAVAQLLGVSQRTVERYVRDQIKEPRADLADRMAAEVRHHAASLLDAQQQGATDRELQQATADALGEVYFRDGDGDRRAHDLLVELTDIEQIQFELWLLRQSS